MSKKRNNGADSNGLPTVSNAVSQSIVHEDVITLDLQNFLTPIAIVVAGLMVSGTLFFSLRNTELTTSNVKGTSTTTTTTTTGTGGTTGTAAADTGETFPTITEDVEIDDDPVLGDISKAKIAIIEFSDYECPFCQRHFNETSGQLYDNYIKNGEAVLVFRDLPLSFHPQAKPAAVSANCVREQGGDSAYYEYHDLLFGKGVSRGDVAYDEYAQEMGMDMNKFNECQTSGKYDAEVTADSNYANQVGCSGTPCFLIGELKDGKVVNAKRIAGAYPYSSFVEVIGSL